MIVCWPNFTLGDRCKLNKSYQNLLLDTY